jgi:hypothetical protein
MGRRLILKEWERLALRNGATMLVRVLALQPRHDGWTVGRYHPTVVGKGGIEQPDEEVFGLFSDDGEFGILSPFQPEGELWLAEPHWPIDDKDCWYRDDYLNDPEGPDGENRKWRPATQMPQRYARERIAVEAVDVMRVSKVTEAMAMAMGVPIPSHMAFSSGGRREDRNESRCALREKIGGKLFDSDPFVWVVTVRRAVAS